MDGGAMVCLLVLQISVGFLMVIVFKGAMVTDGF